MIVASSASSPVPERTPRSLQALPFVLGLLTVLAWPSPCRAYTVETLATSGCHESITASALRAVRLELPTAAPLTSSSDDALLLGDLPFSLPGDMADIGGATLLLGVRDNDLKGISASSLESLSQLATLNADPALQREHCLRSDTEGEPGGSLQAVNDCRGFIHDTLLSALDGLGADGAPEVDTREALDLDLATRGEVTVPVPLFYLRAGRGLHALEDSFTHTFRRVEDPRKITVVLNWIKYADGSLVQADDGPPHLSELDRCDDPDALRATRHRLALEASTAALHALLDPSLSRAAKEDALDAVLDTYVTFDTTAGCTAANRWCDAPELAYEPASCGCGVVGAPAGLPAWLAAGLALLAARSRRRARWLLFGLAALAPRPLLADTPPSKVDPALEGTDDPVGAIFGRLSLGASYDKPAAALGLGGRYQIVQRLQVGLDAEWNPFVDVDPKRVRPGATNLFTSLVVRFPFDHSTLALRTTASVGVSVLLFDLVGAPAGSVGPFVGTSLLGIDWKVSRWLFLTIDPTYLAFPAPHITGAPFVFYQYRFQVGVEFGG